jgi:hypothetical protein
MRREPAVCLALLLSLLVLASCTTPATTTTVTTTTVECTVPDEAADDGADPAMQECTTVTEETEVSHRPRECHGVVSCSFWVAGEAIALPFRALGAVLDIVF